MTTEVKTNPMRDQLIKILSNGVTEDELEKMLKVTEAGRLYFDRQWLADRFKEVTALWKARKVELTEKVKNFDKTAIQKFSEVQASGDMNEILNFAQNLATEKLRLQNDLQSLKRPIEGKPTNDRKDVEEDFRSNASLTVDQWYNSEVYFTHKGNGYFARFNGNMLDVYGNAKPRNLREIWQNGTMNIVSAVEHAGDILGSVKVELSRSQGPKAIKDSILLAVGVEAAQSADWSNFAVVQ